MNTDPDFSCLVWSKEEFSFQRLEASQRSRLLQGTEALNRTSESIARSHQIAAETDQVGTEILGELGRQREVLDRTRTRVC